MMQLIRLLFLSLYFLFTTLQAAQIPDVSATEGLPSSLVNGCVCAITGT